MTNTAIIERDVVVPTASDAGRTPFSWSAAIAGAFAATAVTFIIVALGSGIGLSFASPYGSGPSEGLGRIVAQDGSRQESPNPGSRARLLRRTTTWDSRTR